MKTLLYFFYLLLWYFCNVKFFYQQLSQLNNELVPMNLLNYVSQCC